MSGVSSGITPASTSPSIPALAAGKQAPTSCGDLPFLCRGMTEMWMRFMGGMSLASSAYCCLHHLVSVARCPQLLTLRSWFNVVGRRPWTSSLYINLLLLSPGCDVAMLAGHVSLGVYLGVQLRRNQRWVREYRKC